MIEKLFFLIPILLILMQGSYFVWQVSIVLIFTLVLILKSNDCILIYNKNIVLYFTIIFSGFFLSAISNLNYNYYFEILKYILLFLPFFIKYDKEKWLLSTLIGINIMTLIGVFAYVFKLTDTQLATKIDGVLRMQSIIGYANTTSIFCGIGIILSYKLKEKYKDYKFLFEISLVLNIIGLLLTKSRLGIFSFLLSGIIVLLITNKKLKILSYSILLLASIGVVFLWYTGNIRLLIGSSMVSRIIYYYDGIIAFIANPFGIGISGWIDKQYLYQTSSYSVKYIHNSFLQIVLDGGFIALIGLILFLNSNRKIVDKYVLWAVILMLIHSMVDIDFAFGSVLFVFGILLKNDAVDIKKVKLNKNLVFALFVCVSLCGYYSFFVKETEVVAISREYNTAYTNKNFEKAYQLSELWLKKAPYQQTAFSSYYLINNELAKSNANNEFYLNNIENLRIKVIEINKKENLLTKLIGKYSKIVLPDR